MQILDLKIPKYISSIVQENKTPSSVKTIRGKGIVESRNSFNYEERINLTFEAQKEDLKDFLKVQARFQTLILLPVFDYDISRKIIDAYRVNKLMGDVAGSIDEERKNDKTKKLSEDNLRKEFGDSESSNIKFNESLKKMNYPHIPNVANGFFCFLENFSYKSMPNTIDGFTIEITLCPAEDLTFLNDNRLDYMLKFYEGFNEKREAFKEVDNKIESILGEGYIDDLNIYFDNIYNEQKTIDGKEFPKDEVPFWVEIPNKYIAELEVRSYNNLRRIPIQNKPKGLIQHLGKGEIAVSVKLVINGNTAANEDLVLRLRNIAAAKQKNLSTTDTSFGLFKAFDIKELDLVNLTITDPTDDMNATIVHILFVGACTSIKELNSDYQSVNTRESTTAYLAMFNEFMDNVISYPSNYKDLVIQYNQENKEKYNFTLKDLAESYHNGAIKNLIDKDVKKGLSNEKIFKVEDFKSWLDVAGAFSDRYRQDIFKLDAVLYRYQQEAYYYLKNKDNLSNKVLKQSIDYKEETRKDFFEDVYRLFLAYQFNNTYTSVQYDLSLINMVFQMEIYNNSLEIIKKIIEKDIRKIFTSAEFGPSLFVEGEFNPNIKEYLSEMIDIVYSELHSSLQSTEFEEKVKNFIDLSYGNVLDDSAKYTTSKGIKSAIKLFRERFKDIYHPYDPETKTEKKLDVNYKNLIEGMFKMSVLNTQARDGSYESALDKTFDKELQTVLISCAISSAYIPNLAFEKASLGLMIRDSAQNLIGPMAIVVRSLQERREKLLTTSSDKVVLASDGADMTEVYRQQLKDIEDSENVIKKLFGDKSTGYLYKLSKPYVKSDNFSKDFKTVYGVKVYREFEGPTEFLGDIIKDTVVSKGFQKSYKKMMKSISDYSQESETSNLDKEYPDVKTAVEAKDQLGEANKLMFDKTINKEYLSNTNPSAVLASSLRGEYKLPRSFEVVSKTITADYNQMLPDPEIIVMDPTITQQPLYESEYENVASYIDISNIYHISIKKNDKTNIKNAVVKIVNTRPHFVDPDEVFKDIGIMGDGSDTIKYDNKFITKRKVLREGMLINIGLSQDSEYYDFTGRIESVEINSSDIVLRCTNFAGELFNQTMNINHSFKSGALGVISSNTLRIFKDNSFRIVESINNAKELTGTNGHIIPQRYLRNDYTESKLSWEIASSYNVLLRGIGNSIESLKYLSCSYNDLLSKKSNLSKSKEGSTSAINKFGLTWHELFNEDREINSVNATRIIENVSNIDRDISFYGIEKIKSVKISENARSENYNEQQKAQKEGKDFRFNHSSFIVSESHTGVAADIYSYKRKNITLYELLNDLCKRSPGAFWEIYESGNYATLFFGRGNYEISRKNKVSKLSVGTINSIVDYILTIDTDVKDSELSTIYEQYRASARMYDKSLEADPKYLREIEGFQLKNNSMQEYENIGNRIYAMAGINLISCNITVNENCCNTIVVDYDPTITRTIKNWSKFQKSSSIKLKAFNGLHDYEERVKHITPVEVHSIHTPEQAYEVAQSALFEEMRNYYSGRIVMLYSPDIRKGTEVSILDVKNKFHGTVVVKSFEHILDHETGMITVIEPGMKVGTSSLLSDYYLHSFWKKLSAEFIQEGIIIDKNSMADKFSDANKSTTNILSENLLNATKNGMDLPIILEEGAYQYDYKGDTDERDLKNFKGMRAKSNLPLKIYPIVKGGKPVMPDADIYGRQKNLFSGFTSAMLSIRYLITMNVADAGKKDFYIKYAMDLFSSKYDLSDEEAIREISRQFLAFDDEDFFNSVFTMGNTDLLGNNTGAIGVDQKVLDGKNVGFINCKELKHDEDERIDRIAKIMAHFSIAGFVELNGCKDKKIEKNNFTVVKKLKEKMEHYSEAMGKPCKKWHIVTEERLIREMKNADYFDDVGAILVNKENLKGIAKGEKVEIKTVFKDGKEDFRCIPTIEIFRNEPDISGMTGGYTTKSVIGVFHNLYGKTKLDNKDETFLKRTDIMDNVVETLMEKDWFTSHNMLLGDFNLSLRARLRDSGPATSSNEYYKFPYDSVQPLMVDRPTTKSGKCYDNVVVNTKKFNQIASPFHYFVNDNGDIFTEYNYDDDGKKIKNDYFISDHKPILTVIKEGGPLDVF